MATAETQLAVRKRAKARTGVGVRRSLRVPTNILWYVILILGAIVSLFPYWLALMTSLKPANQIFVGQPWALPANPTLQNYITVMTQYSFPTYLLNTLLFAVVITLGQLIFSTMAAYVKGMEQSRATLSAVPVFLFTQSSCDDSHYSINPTI